MRRQDHYVTRERSHVRADKSGTPKHEHPSGTRIPKAIALPSTFALALTLLLALIFALSYADRASAQAGLTVEILSGYNLVVDSNVSSPSTYGPSAATVAARICNDGTQPITDVVVHIGDYANLTPGIYPARGPLSGTFSTEHPALVDGGGDYAFTHVGGSLGLGDATRQAGGLQPGQCTVQYWTFEYPRCENVAGAPDEPPCANDPVWGDSVKPEDDLWLTFDVWATGFDGSGTITTAQSWKMTMRNEISAMANKIQPNGNPSGVWFNTDTNNVRPGAVITTNGILYRIGNVRFGFDNDGDYLPDYNFWVQPIGDAGQFDPGCFRLIRTSGVITIAGSTPTVINFADQLYFSQPQVPDDNTNVIGEVFYTFLALGSNCAATPTPYQEAASGYDNEKFNADYGAGGPPGMTNEAALVGVDKTSNPDLIGVGQIITYRIPFINSGTEPAGLTLYQGTYVNNPLVISDTIPEGAIYSTDSATYTLSTAGDVTIRYSTDNGQTWSDSEPASGVTTIQWWLQEPLPPDESGDAYLSVIIPLTYTGAPVIENCANAQFDSGVSITEVCKLVIVEGPYTLGNEVWQDDDADGQIDAGEPYLNGITLSLYWDRNGDGVLDSGDPFIMTTTTGITATGHYTFSSLYTGTYIVQVDRDDPNIPTGYRASTPINHAVALGSTQPSYLNADFGFGPSLGLQKSLVGSCYEGWTITHTVTITNLRGGSGQATTGGCQYTVWAETDNTSGSQLWNDRPNALGRSGPDNLFANSGWPNAPDRLRVTDFLISAQPGSISQVEVMAWLYTENGSIGSAGAPDQMSIEVLDGSNNSVTSTIYTTELNNYSTTANIGMLVWDITADTGGWDWIDYTDAQIELTTDRNAGDDGEAIYVDAIGFRISTNESCSSDAITTVPLTDTYDPLLLQFVSASPAQSSVDTINGVITWTNVGPLQPGDSTDLSVVFRVLEPSPETNTPVTNTVGISGATFFDGSFANNGFDSATCTITPTRLISGVVWSDTDSDGWVGATGYESGTDLFIPGVTVTLYACYWDNGDGLITSLDPDYDGTDTCADQRNGGVRGEWLEVDAQLTDADGGYSFAGLFDGFYYVAVITTSIPDPMPNQTGDPDETGGTCTTCDSQSPAPTIVLGSFTELNQANGDQTDINFGYDIQAALYGTIWRDVDGDGTRETGEDGLDNGTVGITVTLTWSGGISTTQTDAAGYYEFAGLSYSGTYTITVDTSSLPGSFSWSNTSDPDGNLDSVYTLAVQSGEVSGSHNFGYYYPGTYSLGDTVYVDWNGDGDQDAGEQGIDTIDVFLYRDVDGDGVLDIGSDLLYSTTTTANSGYYTFTQLVTGTYFAVVDTSDIGSHWSAQGWDIYQQTQDPDESGVCIPGVNCDSQGTGVLSYTQTSLATIDFGYQPRGNSSIGDYVWSDVNGNGFQDPSETGIADILVSLYYDGDNDGVISPTVDALIMTATTDANGNYIFPNLSAGDYLVDVDTDDLDLPTDGYGSSYALSTNNDPHDVALNTNENYDDADFGFTAAGVVGDFVWQDNDADGEQDAGEPGIAGVTVTLYYSGGVTVYATTTTDARGAYTFTGVPSNTYVIEVETSSLPAGYVQSGDPDATGWCDDTNGFTFDDCDSQSAFRLRLGQVDRTRDFGYKPPRVIGDFVWIDANADGIQDPGEPGIPGVVISVTIPGDGTITGTTDIDGYYSFGSDVLTTTGVYTVEVYTATLPITMVATYDRDGTADSFTLVTLTDTTVLTDVDFGYRYDGPYQITGTVFFDVGETSDGLTDTFTSGDIPYSGITVYLYNDSARRIGTTTTDASGQFTFTYLYGGGISYTVAVDRFAPELISSTLTASPDGANYYHTVVITDRSIGYQDFGFYEPFPVLTVTKTVSPTDPVEAGQVLTYSIVVSNSGSVTATTVTVSDTIPDNTTYVSSSLSIAPPTAGTATEPTGGLIHLSPLTVGANLLVTITFQVTVVNPVPVGVDTITNTVVMTGPGPGGSVVTHTDSATVTVVTPAVAIAKTPDNQVVESGGTVTFTIAVTNTGGVTLTNVVVADAVAPACDATIGILASTQVSTYTCSLVVSGDLTNTAIVTGTSPAGTTVTDTDDARVTVVTPTVAIDKSPDSQVVEAGGTVTFTIAVTNTGTVTLTNVVVSDTPYTSCDWVVGTMPVGDVQTNTCVVSPVTTDFTNTVVVTGTSPAGTTVTDTDTADVTVLVPDITLAKTPDTQTVEAGQTVTFTIAVTNTGQVTLTNVVVTDALAPNCADAFGPLAVDEVYSYSCTLTDVVAGFANTAVATGTTPGGNVVTATDTADVTVLVPDIVIEKTPDTQTVEAGQTVTFTIAVTNTGTVTLTNVVISDTVAPACDASIGILASTQVSTYTCSLVVSGNLTNTAVVTGTSPAGTTVTDTDDARVTVVTPSITIDKAPDNQVVEAGGTVTFTIAVTNTGTVTLTNVVVADAVAPACDASIGILASTQVSTYTCSLVVSADLTNTAIVTGTSPAGTTVTDIDDARVTVVTPTVAIDKAPDNQVVESGGTVTFTIAVTNTGTVTLTNVVVSDTPYASCDWVVGDMPVGDVQTNTCVVSPVTTDFTNTAVVTGTSPAGTTVTDTDDARVTVVTPTVAIAKSPDSQVVEAGGTVTFTIAVTNTGTVTLTNVVVSDTVAPSCDWVVGTMPVGDVQTNTCVVSPVSAAFTNTVVVTGTSPAGTTSTDTDDARVTVVTPSIAIEKSPGSQSVLIGGTVTFTIIVTNTGQVPLDPAVVTDIFAPACVQTISPLTVGQVYSYTCTQPNVNTDFVNTAVVSGTSPAGTVVTDTDDAWVTVINPNLAITKTLVTSEPVQVGDPIQFVIVIQNTGTITLTTVPLTDTYDTAYLTYVSATPPSDDNADDGTINWTHVGQIAPGASVTVTVNFVAAGSTQALPGFVTTNTATVSATDAGGNDLPPDTDDDTVEIYDPGIQVIKTVNQATVVPSQLVTYTITITNVGDVPLYPVVVTDTLEPGLTYQSGTANPPPSSVVGQQLVWSDVTGGSPLSPGGNTQIAFVAQVTVPAGTHRNYVTVDGEHPRGVVTDTDEVPIFATDPTLEIAKDVAPPGGAVNGVITFTIHITNTGPSTLDVVPLVDRFVGPVAFIRSTPPPDAFDSVGQVLTWTDLAQSGPSGFGRNLDPGESFVITTVFQVVAADEYFTMTNTVIVTDAQDTYSNPANEDQDDARVINIPTAVELLYFRATPQPGAVLLEWETAVEIDNYGFFVLRSTTTSLADAQEVGFIPAAGRGRGSGAAYSFKDLDAHADLAYTYWLVDVDTNEQRTVHAPVTVTALPKPDLPYRIYLPIVRRD